jgi:hypothetical protein
MPLSDLQIYTTEFFYNGIVKMVVVAPGFSEAVRMICDKIREEMPAKDMSGEALPKALQNLRRLDLTDGVLFYGYEIIQ